MRLSCSSRGTARVRGEYILYMSSHRPKAVNMWRSLINYYIDSHGDGGAEGYGMPCARSRYLLFLRCAWSKQCWAGSAGVQCIYTVPVVVRVLYTCKIMSISRWSQITSVAQRLLQKIGKWIFTTIQYSTTVHDSECSFNRILSNPLIWTGRT